MGGNFKFQVQIVFLEYFFFEIWRSKERIALSEKKSPLAALVEILWGGINHAYPDWCNQKIMLILMSILHSLLPLSLVSPSNIYLQ